MKWGKKVEFTLEYERESGGIPIYKAKNKKQMKDKKLSSYQKLKQQNQELRDECRMLMDKICVVCFNPESYEVFEIKMEAIARDDYNKLLKYQLQRQSDLANGIVSQDFSKISILPHIYQIKLK